MPQKCAHCTRKIPEGTEFVEYGGLCWCGIDCLAQYYVEHEERFERSGKRLEDIEQGIHYKIVSTHDTAAGPP